MRQFLERSAIAVLWLTAMVFVLWAIGAGRDLVSQASPCEKQRPIQIIRLSPDENATVTDAKVTLSALLELLKGRGIVPPRSLQLFLDGVDLTARSSIASSMDLPPSRGEIFYEPTEPFAFGKHTAEVQFANDQNERFSYSWNFCIEKVPIPEELFCQEMRPIQIVGLFPGENATLFIQEVNSVGADFEFLKGGDIVPPASLRLFLDGDEVTSKAQVTTSMDVLTSRGRIEYKLLTPLASGKHTAEIRFANDRGRAFSYQWHFYTQQRD